jgi:tetratricopeptide (TPR) repeat protein
MGGCVAGEARLKDVLRTFEIAAEAARNDAQPIGELDTLLAKASFLLEIEKYAGAFEALDEVLKLVQSLRGGIDSAQLALRAAIAHRKRAEAYLQAARLDGVNAELSLARSLAHEAKDDVELTLLRILRAELHHIEVTPPTVDDLNGGAVDDETRYRYHLVLSESERRLGHRQPNGQQQKGASGSEDHWKAAADHLRDELRLSRGDQRRLASLHYRMSRLAHDQWSAGLAYRGLPIGDERARSGKTALLKPAIRHSAWAITLFKRMGDPIGIVRARTQLARSLTAAQLLVDAEVECAQAHDGLIAFVERNDIAYLPLAARIARARAELLLYREDHQDACRQFIIASKLFAQCGDWSSQASVNAIMKAMNASGFPTGSAPFFLDHLTAGSSKIAHDVAIDR